MAGPAECDPHNGHCHFCQLGHVGNRSGRESRDLLCACQSVVPRPDAEWRESRDRASHVTHEPVSAGHASFCDDMEYPRSSRQGRLPAGPAHDCFAEVPLSFGTRDEDSNMVCVYYFGQVSRCEPLPTLHWPVRLTPEKDPEHDLWPPFGDSGVLREDTITKTISCHNTSAPVKHVFG